MTDGEQLKRFIDQQKRSKVSIAESLGITRTTLYQYFESKVLEPETKKKLEDLFKVHIFEAEEAGDTPAPAETKSGDFRAGLWNKKVNGEKEEIKVYDLGTRNSFINIYDDDAMRNYVPVGSLNPSVFPGCNHAERVTGDSMYPMITNQAIVVGDRMDKDRLGGIVSGERYVVHTRKGLRTCKYVHIIEDQPERIRLVALNKTIPPQIVELADITLLMRVYYIINPA